MSGRTILIITSATDTTATYLGERLSARGLPFVRFDTETFPGEWGFHWAIEPARPARLVQPGRSLDLSQIGAVWYRRPAPPGISPEIIEPAAREFALRECEQTLAALWQCLDVLWVNHPIAIRNATRKPHQLGVARGLGLSVPATILSTDPVEVHAFWEEHDHAVIFKTLHQDAIEVAGRNYFAYATRLTDEHIPALEQLRLAPAIFQQYIEPALEIRVTLIGEHIFAAAIDTAAKLDGPDWRRLAPDDQVWVPHDLPDDVAKRCREILRVYGLCFGAIDLILTVAGEYVFLELNANGQWVWIELITGMPMCEAMVNLLLRGHQLQMR